MKVDTDAVMKTSLGMCRLMERVKAKAKGVQARPLSLPRRTQRMLLHPVLSIAILHQESL